MEFNITSKRSIFSVLCLFFLVGVFLLIGFGYYLMSPNEDGGRDKIVLVRHGSTLKEVAHELETRGIINNKSLFLLWARLMGYGSKIKAGEYRLNSGIPPVEVLGILCKGEIILHSATIPEGFTRKQIGDLLEKKGLVDKDEFLSLTGDKDIVKSYGVSAPDLEGYLFPDTYHFARGLGSMLIIDVMVKRFLEVVGPLRERAQDLGDRKSVV